MSNVKIKANASGTADFTIQAPATDSAVTMTLPADAGTILTDATDIAVQATANTPICEVRLGAHQEINVSTYTKVQFDTVGYDPDSLFDRTTNYRFQPTVEGYYRCTFAVQAGSGGIRALTTQIRKNNTSYVITGGQYFQNDSIGDDLHSSVDKIIYMNGSTDYLECYAFIADGTSSTDYLFADYNSGTCTIFSAYLIRSGS